MKSDEKIRKLAPLFGVLRGVFCRAEGLGQTFISLRLWGSAELAKSGLHRHSLSGRGVGLGGLLGGLGRWALRFMLGPLPFLYGLGERE